MLLSTQGASARVQESGSHDDLGTEKTSAGDAKPVKIKQ